MGFSELVEARVLVAALLSAVVVYRTPEPSDGAKPATNTGDRQNQLVSQWRDLGGELHAEPSGYPCRFVFVLVVIQNRNMGRGNMQLRSAHIPVRVLRSITVNASLWGFVQNFLPITCTEPYNPPYFGWCV